MFCSAIYRHYSGYNINQLSLTIESRERLVGDDVVGILTGFFVRAGIAGIYANLLVEDDIVVIWVELIVGAEVAGILAGLLVGDEVVGVLVDLLVGGDN